MQRVNLVQTEGRRTNTSSSLKVSDRSLFSCRFGEFTSRETPQNDFVPLALVEHWRCSTYPKHFPSGQIQSSEVTLGEGHVLSLQQAVVEFSPRNCYLLHTELSAVVTALALLIKTCFPLCPLESGTFQRGDSKQYCVSFKIYAVGIR